MKTAISLPDDLFDAAESEAKRLGISRSKLVQIALEDFIRAATSSDVTAALNRSYAQNPEPSAPWLEALAQETMRNTEWVNEAGTDLVDQPRATKRVGARLPAARRHRLGK
jgi:hypothetical protein